MKELIKKNQLMITALAIMLAIAGYLQFSGKDVEKNKELDAADVLQAAGEVMDEEELTQANSDTVLYQVSDVTDLMERGEEVISREDLKEVDILDMGDEFEDSAFLEENMEMLDAIPEDGVIPGNEVFSMADGNLVLSEAKLLKEQVRARNKETLMAIIENETLSGEEKQAALDSMVRMTEYAQEETDVETLLETKGFEGAVVSVSAEGVDVVINATNVSDQERVQIEDIVTRKTGRNASDIVISTLVP